MMSQSYTIPAIFFLLLASFWGYLVLGGKIRRYSSEQLRRGRTNLISPGRLESPQKSQICAASSEFAEYKTLYHKLQNLEAYPDTLPAAYTTLIRLFSSALMGAQGKPASILSCDGSYTEAKLHSFLKSESARLSRDWESYLRESSPHDPCTRVKDLDAAKQWLRRISPSKLVDGAWLGHIHKVTTPFSLRKVTKQAWQVYSEELGDGDLRKNHVFVFRDLLASAGIDLPDSAASAFTELFQDPSQDMQAIRSGVAQLLISLFPDDFLPEILGFNMHFERVTLETLIASKELPEIGMDPTYFRLHVCIDNAHSGHTAMATQTVVEYLELLHEAHGPEQRDIAWRRVQAGYQLSVWTGEEKNAGADLVVSHRDKFEDGNGKDLGSKVAKMIAGKSTSARDIHCLSKVKIAGLRLTDWVDTMSVTSGTREEELLNDLSGASPWIVRGDSNKSKLIQCSLWGGKMFGCFTQSEIKILRGWIDSLVPTSPQFYWRFTGRSPTPTNSLSAGRAASQNVSASPLSPDLVSSFALQRPFSGAPLPKLIISEKAVAKGLLSLWFSHPSLLECAVSIPARMTTPLASAMLCCLRAQHGFPPDDEVEAETHNSQSENRPDMVEIGLELMKVMGLEATVDLPEVLTAWPNAFAQQMLDMSTKPIELQDILIGTTIAFVELHRAACSYELLSVRTRLTLAQLVEREEYALKICISEIEQEEERYQKLIHGYKLGLENLGECFS